jgi:hypothetical protein
MREIKDPIDPHNRQINMTPEIDVLVPELTPKRDKITFTRSKTSRLVPIKRMMRLPMDIFLCVLSFVCNGVKLG